jgi:ubiquinone/menaquinone biosynthesis C-methylase UbiE
VFLHFPSAETERYFDNRYNIKKDNENIIMNLLERNRQDAMVPQSEIGPLYDKLAGIYDIWGKLTESRARNRAIELAEIRDGQTVLEVAVGTGLAFYEIVQRNPNGLNVGIDLSKGMLEKAENRLRKIPATNYVLRVGSALDLEIEDESIDVLMNNYMFDLISFEAMDTVLTEFKRVLKSEGRLILVNMTQGEGFGSQLYDLVYTISPKTMGGCRGVSLSNRLKAQGFRVEARANAISFRGHTRV